MRWWMVAALGVVGCDANFERFEVASDGIPSGGDVDLGGPKVGSQDAGPGTDGGANDLGVADAGVTDLGAGEDAGSVDLGEQNEERVLSQGPWENRGYRVSGSAQVVQLPDGRFVIRMSEDFVAFDLPGPTLLFSDRTSLGRSGIQPSQGDVRIGRLTDLTGPLEIEIPAEAAERAFAWIYCEPFSAEMHAAELRAP